MKILVVSLSVLFGMSSLATDVALSPQYSCQVKDRTGKRYLGGSNLVNLKVKCHFEKGSLEQQHCLGVLSAANDGLALCQRDGKIGCQIESCQENPQ